MNTHTTYKIRPAGRHILTIGEDLIQDNHAAVVELVKNAYDADATYVNIEFKASSNGKTYAIVVDDNGHGMSRNDVIHKWMVPSTRDKRDRGTSPLGRTLQGRKGIGRYASSILGDDLLLETVNADGEKTTVCLEWNDFHTAEYLDDVEILIETQKTTRPSGTRLTMHGNSKRVVEWNKDRFQKLQFELKKLKSPVGSIFTNDEFRINLTVRGFVGVQDFEEIVEPFPLFELYDYKIAGNIGIDGKGTLEYSSQKARNTVKQELRFDFKKPTGCGNLDFDIRVYDRDKESIDALVQRSSTNDLGNSVGKLEARQLLNKYNGIGVYRSGFRIRPLGDAEYDWLKLNSRRVQNPSMCIGSDQAIGYVQIESENDSGLIEKSARDGLRENEAFDLLRKVTTAVIMELEVLRFDYRDKVGLGRFSRKVDYKLGRLFSFDPMRSKIQRQLKSRGVDESTAEMIDQIVIQVQEEKNKGADEIRQAVAIYQGQATLGKIVNVILHEGRRPLSYFQNRIPHLKSWVNSFQKNRDFNTIVKLEEIATGVLENMEFFVHLFRRLDPLAAGKRGAKKHLDLKKAINGTLSIFEGEMKTQKVSVDIIGPDNFKFPFWSQDIYAIFTNLIDNSLYWINQKKNSKRNITVTLLTDRDSLVHIDYRDTGPGIEPSHIASEIIFEPQFSTKPNGTGLGLTIAGEAAERNGLELKAFESNDGAYFRLQPKNGKQG